MSAVEPAAPASPEAADLPAAAPVAAAPPGPDLRALFAPTSVAIVGASLRGHLARIVRDNLRTIGSDAHCHFVNPKYDSLLGEPCYPSLDALPEAPDCVLVALGPGRAAAAVEDAARAGARSVIVPGGGIIEGGEPARLMQAEVGRIARVHGLALVGPNCMGFIDHTSPSAVYIGDVNPWQPRGVVAGIAQSGSVTDAFVQAGTRIGFSRIVSCGAEVMLDACDYLGYCIDDPETQAIIMFLEGLKRPERFLALADRALELGKPIAVVKVGRSAQAQASAVAHSGSLAGENRITAAALDAAGVIRCSDLDELLETAELMAGCHRLGRRVGRARTGVITVSTGEASLIADLAPETGIDLPPVPQAARERLLAALPTLGYVGNPLDPWGADDPARAYEAAFGAFADSGAYDVLALVHDSPYRELLGEVETGTTVASALVGATRDRPDLMPVLISLTSGEVSHKITRVLHGVGGVPYLRGLREGFRAIALRARWEARQAARLARGAPPREGWIGLAADRTPYGLDAPESVGPSPGDRVVLAERESLELLRAAGLPVVEARAAGDAASSSAAAEALGYPVAVKLDAVGLAHKSDIGGVRLGLADAAEVVAAATDVLAAGAVAGADVRGVMVVPMAAPGVELIVGLVRDPQYGPAVLVGLGGVLAEVLRDTAVRLAPVSEVDALEMLAELRGADILDGVRGQPPVDRSAVARLIAALGRLGLERPELLAVDLNPVVAGPWGVLAVDALCVVAAGAAPGSRP